MIVTHFLSHLLLNILVFILLVLGIGVLFRRFFFGGFFYWGFFFRGFLVGGSFEGNYLVWIFSFWGSNLKIWSLLPLRLSWILFVRRKSGLLNQGFLWLQIGTLLGTLLLVDVFWFHDAARVSLDVLCLWRGIFERLNGQWLIHMGLFFDTERLHFALFKFYMGFNYIWIY